MGRLRSKWKLPGAKSCLSGYGRRHPARWIASVCLGGRRQQAVSPESLHYLRRSLSIGFSAMTTRLPRYRTRHLAPRPRPVRDT